MACGEANRLARNPVELRLAGEDEKWKEMATGRWAKGDYEIHPTMTLKIVVARSRIIKRPTFRTVGSAPAGP